ncbi:hypothetical protein ACNKHK_22070 [Shigella flexneri]
MPNVMVYTAGKKMPLVVEGSGEFNWLLTTEEGAQHKGHAAAANLSLFRRSCRRGSHVDPDPGRARTHCRIIVAPKRCDEPQALLAGQKLWRACVQLYTLRLEKNWGIGDLAISSRCW